MRRRYLCGAIAGVLAIAAALSATAGGATSSLRHVRDHRITNSSSSNWSGYAVTGSRFTSVSSSWTSHRHLLGDGLLGFLGRPGR